VNIICRLYQKCRRKKHYFSKRTRGKEWRLFYIVRQTYPSSPIILILPCTSYISKKIIFCK